MSEPELLTAITRTVQSYFEGMHCGDVSLLRNAFDPAACVVGFYQGTFMRQTLDEWMSEVEGLPKPREQGEPFEMKIVTLDVSGRLAYVKVAILYLGLRFTDVLTLVQFDEGWKITHKAYRHD